MSGAAGGNSAAPEPTLLLPRDDAPPREASHHSLRSLGHGSLLLLIGQVVLVGATFLTRVLLVTTLGDTRWGDLAVGLALTGLVGQLASLGLASAAPRQLAHTTDARERWLIARNSLLMVLPAAVASALLLVLAAPFLGRWLGDTNIPVVMEFLAVNTALSLVSGVLTSYYQGNENALPNALFNQILNPLMTVGFMALFLLRSASLTSALWAYIVAAVATLLCITTYTFSRNGYPWRVREAVPPTGEEAPPVSSFGALLRFALPLAVVGLATAAVGTSDTLVLEGVSRSATEVGAYSSVLPLARLVSLAVTALAYMMLPVSSRLHRLGDMRELAASYATITKWVLVITLPLFLIFFCFPAQSLSFVYHPTYLTQSAAWNAPLLLQVTCLGALVATIVGPSASVLVGLGKLRWLFLNTVLSAVVDAGLALLLCPFWGALGAAVAFAAATGVLPILSVAQTYRAAHVHPFTGPMLKPLLLVGLPAAALMLGVPRLVTLAFPSWLLVGLYFLLMLLYFGAILVTRSIEAEDEHLLQVVESYIGRLPWLRNLAKRFLAAGPGAGPVPPGDRSPK